MQKKEKVLEKKYAYIYIYLNEMEEMSDNSKDMEIVSSYWKPVPSKKQK